MKVITISEKNMKEVYGRIRKFFYNKNNTGFISWHNFDCGFKKHIPALKFDDGERVIHKYPSPNDVMLLQMGGNSYIGLRLTATDGMSLACGDKIAFVGNRIICRKEWFLDNHKYVYDVFQAIPMSNDKQDEKRYIAQMEADA